MLNITQKDKFLSYLTVAANKRNISDKHEHPSNNSFPTANVFSKPTKVGFCDTRWKLSPCHMHTFGLTDKHVLLPEQPMTVDVTAMVANTMRDKPLIDGMEWLKNKQVGACLGSCLKTGQHSIFFNYTFISAYKIYFLIPYQRYCFGYFVCATEFHCEL